MSVVFPESMCAEMPMFLVKSAEAGAADNARNGVLGVRAPALPLPMRRRHAMSRCSLLPKYEFRRRSDAPADTFVVLRELASLN